MMVCMNELNLMEISACNNIDRSRLLSGKEPSETGTSAMLETTTINIVSIRSAAKTFSPHRNVPTYISLKTCSWPQRPMMIRLRNEFCKVYLGNKPLTRLFVIDKTMIHSQLNAYDTQRINFKYVKCFKLSNFKLLFFLEKFQSMVDID